MSTRWERLAGDTGEFAPKLAFTRDPDDGRAADRDVSLSWGSFQIWVEGRNLCAHNEGGERSESVHWYLLPLMEWFVSRWNPLLHEERLPASNEGDTAWESLRATRFPPHAIEEDDQKASSWESAWHERIGTAFPDDEFVDVEDVLRQLGVNVVDRDLSDETIRGVALHGAHHRPGILVNPRHSANAQPVGRRFTLAHELCHLLFDRDAGAELAIASSPWAPCDIERRANAFAAMFLMPNRLVRRAVSALTGSLETRDAVLSVANRLRASFGSTLWHLKNLGYIDDVTRERIENEPQQQQPA